MIVPLAMLLVAAMVNAQSTTTTPSASTTTSSDAGTTTSAPVATSGSDAGSTTTVAAGSGDSTTSTAAGGTTVAGATGATTCTDEACCKAIEDGAQPCTKCAKSTGCTFYGLFNNNVFSAGGKCVLSTTATPPTTGYKKIEKYGECADLCAKLACSTCIGIPECKWCDTAAAVGVGSTGSCELAKCNTGVTALTTCSSAAATAASVAAAAVAAVFML
jgi:hypothetical protein